MLKLIFNIPTVNLITLLPNYGKYFEKIENLFKNHLESRREVGGNGGLNNLPSTLPLKLPAIKDRIGQIAFGGKIILVSIVPFLHPWCLI